MDKDYMLGKFVLMVQLNVFKTMKNKTDYKQIFMENLGNPLDQLDNLIVKAHTLSEKQKFINRFGENPVDVLGQDWENCVEDYKEMVSNEETLIDK